MLNEDRFNKNHGFGLLSRPALFKIDTPPFGRFGLRFSVSRVLTEKPVRCVPTFDASLGVPIKGLRWTTFALVAVLAANGLATAQDLYGKKVPTTDQVALPSPAQVEKLSVFPASVSLK